MTALSIVVSTSAVGMPRCLGLFGWLFRRQPLTVEQEYQQYLKQDYLVLQPNWKEELLKRARAVLDERGVAYEVVPGFGDKLRILPVAGKSNLNTFAKSLQDNLGGTAVTYDPIDLILFNREGGFSGNDGLNLSHQAILNKRIDETTIHEALHAFFWSLGLRGENSLFNCRSIELRLHDAGNLT